MKSIIAVILCFAATGSLSQELAQEELDKYLVLKAGICEDVQLPCVEMVRKDIDVYYAIFNKIGDLVAITRVRNDREEVVWGKLPDKPKQPKGEKVWHF